MRPPLNITARDEATKEIEEISKDSNNLRCLRRFVPFAVNHS